jgi:hypothetical protein
MMTPGDSKPINPWTFVFTPETRQFVAMMAGPFCLQLSALEALALADLLRIAAGNVRDGRSSSTLTTIRLENWTVVATDTGSVALIRKSLMVRFTVDEADRAASLLDEAADAMDPHRFGEVANA